MPNFTNDKLEVLRPFGPTIAKVKMPQDLIDKLKPDLNITGDFNALKYIDFGLTAEMENKKHFIERSQTEGNTKRLYYL